MTLWILMLLNPTRP
jgi:hypothetical protein